MNVEKFERARRKRNKLADEMADIKDKIDRTLNIMNTKEQWVEDESIIDSAEDFINYCILYFMYLVEDDLVDIEAIKEENND